MHSFSKRQQRSRIACPGARCREFVAFSAASPERAATRPRAAPRRACLRRAGKRRAAVRGRTTRSTPRGRGGGRGAQTALPSLAKRGRAARVRAAAARRTQAPHRRAPRQPGSQARPRKKIAGVRGQIVAAASQPGQARTRSERFGGVRRRDSLTAFASRKQRRRRAAAARAEPAQERDAAGRRYAPWGCASAGRAGLVPESARERAAPMSTRAPAAAGGGAIRKRLAPRSSRRGAAALLGAPAPSARARARAHLRGGGTGCSVDFLFVVSFRNQWLASVLRALLSSDRDWAAPQGKAKGRTAGDLARGQARG
jgi:hypothetical protein